MATVSCNGKRFTNIRAIFLDKDGTLVNVASYLSQLGRTQAALMERQLSGSHELTLKALGFAPGLSASGVLAVGSRQETILASATVAAMAGASWGQAVELATATWTAADQTCCPKARYTPLLPGALDFLKRLKQANLKTILASADSQHNLEEFVRYYQLQPYFDRLQGTSARFPDKTAPDFLHTACHAVGIVPEQGLVVGDAATDFQMAQITRGFIGFLGGWQPTVSAESIIRDRACSIDYDFATEFGQILLD